MKKNNPIWSRRKFIASVTTTGAAILVTPYLSWATPAENSKIASIVAQTMGIDTHNHVDVPLDAAELPGPKINLSEEVTKSGLAAIVMTFAVDYQKLTAEGQAYERFLNGLTAMDKVLEDNNMKRSLNLSDLKKAYKTKTPTVIQSVEGGHFLEGKIERLEVAYNRGLRHLTLLHDNDASVPLGDIFTNPQKWNGLTSFGAQTIKECERLGILVDLSHCDNNTVDGAIKVMTKPFIISHTGLNTRLGEKEFMAKMMMPRLISEEQARKVAKAGGVIGVWTHLAESPREYAQNIKAMVDIVGIDHVAIGTDTKLTPAYHSPNEQMQRGNNDKNEQPKKANDKDDFKSKEENKKPNKGGGSTNETWGVEKKGFYYIVVEELLKLGFTEKEIAKIGAENYCRIFDAATKNH